MSDDFDWNSSDGKVQRLYGSLAIYTNPYRDIVIRQRGDITDEQDHFVVIPRSLVSWTIAAVEDEAKLAQEDEGEGGA